MSIYWLSRLYHPAVEEWLKSHHPIGSPESLRLARRAQAVLNTGDPDNEESQP